MSPKNPDIGPFVSRGGRLIIAHGWSDPPLNALATIDYYDAVRTRTCELERSVRLFLMPGVLPCSGGTGSDTVAWFRTIADWVEFGVTPDRVVALEAGTHAVPWLGTAHDSNASALWVPKVAAYSGTGSADEAKNFSCK